VDVSPLSTLGALCLAALPAGENAPALFKRLFLWGLSMTVVAAVLCQLFMGVMARALLTAAPAGRWRRRDGPRWPASRGHSSRRASSAASTAARAPMKPIFEWVPSQNGLLGEPPQRQSE